MGFAVFLIVIAIICIKLAPKSKKRPKAALNAKNPMGQSAYGSQSRSTSYSAYGSQTQTMNGSYKQNVSQTAASSSQAYKSGTSIVERAKQNVKKYQPDQALNEMEQTHAHKETEKPTNVKAESAAIKAAHPKNAEHVGKLITEEERSNLKKIKELMITGYEPQLEFERDFVAEGMDMINRFIYQDY